MHLPQSHLFVFLACGYTFSSHGNPGNWVTVGKCMFCRRKLRQRTEKTCPACPSGADVSFVPGDWYIGVIQSNAFAWMDKRRSWSSRVWASSVDRPSCIEVFPVPVWCLAPASVAEGALTLLSLSQHLQTWTGPSQQSFPRVLSSRTETRECLVFSLSPASEPNFQKVKIAHNYNTFRS